MASTNVAFDMRSPFNVSGITGSHDDLTSGSANAGLSAPQPMRPIPVGVNWNTGGGRLLRPISVASDTGSPSNPGMSPRLADPSVPPISQSQDGGEGGGDSGGSGNGGGDTPSAPSDDPISRVIGLIAGQQASGGGGSPVALPATVTSTGGGSGSGMVVVLLALAGIGLFIFFNRKRKAE